MCLGDKKLAVVAYEKIAEITSSFANTKDARNRSDNGGISPVEYEQLNFGVDVT
jgi:hypothetical protein